ncbi:MAG: hypothetical protein ACFE7I_06635 [Candidatus Hodarchaeota archaeon]
MKRRRVLTTASIALLALLSIAAITPAMAIPLPDPTPYLGHNFNQESWSNEVDWIGDVISPILVAGGVDPGAIGLNNISIFTYNAYVNKYDYQMFYIGLLNWSYDTGLLNYNGTIPMQAILSHFYSPSGFDVFVLNNFVSVGVFNDSIAGIAGIPDPTDDLYVSLSLGFGEDYFGVGGTLPTMSVTTYPLTSSSGGNVWQWGMKYEDLVSLWWDVEIGGDHGFRAIAVYEGLTFNYTLTFDTDNNTATISTNYEIGRPTDLYVLNWAGFTPTGWDIYNDTSTPTVTEQLEAWNMSIGIVSYQLAVTVGQAYTVRSHNNGTAVSPDAYRFAHDDTLETLIGSEKVYETDFSSKEDYKLYNIGGSLNGTYQAKTVLYPVTDYENNYLLQLQMLVAAPMPFIALYLSPQIAQNATNLGDIVDMGIGGSDAFYIVSYPHWYGLRVVHDPTFVAYTGEGPGGFLDNPIFLVAVVGGIAVAVGAVVVLVRKRGK